MAFVTVGKENGANIELYYEDHGTGAPVILIHGYPLNGASWEKQVPALLNAGFRAVTYDRRGFGRSSKPSIGYDYDTLTADLKALIDHLKLKDFFLVGFSMGSGEVVRFMSKYGSNSVKKAVCISGVPPYLLKTDDNPEGVDSRVFDSIQNSVALDRYSFFSEFFNNFYDTDFYLGERISEEALKASFNIAVTSSALACSRCVSSWLEDFRNDVPHIDIPLLVIHGETDRIVPFNASGKRLAKLVKNAHLHVIKNGPHAINFTHADEVNAELLRFFQS